MTNYENEYVEESKDIKPIDSHFWQRSLYEDELRCWQERFIKWLTQRLERVEGENKEKTEWSLNILKRINKVDSLLDRCSGTIASGAYPEGQRSDIKKLLDELAHFNQE